MITDQRWEYIYKKRKIHIFFFLGRDLFSFFFSCSRSCFLSFFHGRKRVFFLFSWILLFSWSKGYFLSLSLKIFLLQIPISVFKIRKWKGLVKNGNLKGQAPTWTERHFQRSGGSQVLYTSCQRPTQGSFMNSLQIIQSLWVDE